LNVFYSKPEYLPRGSDWGGSGCGNRIYDANFLTVFRSNYRSVLLSFRDMTTGGTTDGRTTDDRWTDEKDGQASYGSDDILVVCSAKLIGTNCTMALSCCFCADYVPHSDCIGGRCQCVSSHYSNQLGTVCIRRT